MDGLEGIDTAFARHGLALSVQHWMDLGRGDDPLTGCPNDIEEAAARITSLMAIRILGLYHYYKDDAALLDLATSTICRAVMEVKEEGEGALSAKTIRRVAAPSLMLQLETFVTCMLYGYHNKQNPFHNYQHAYHVVISANKFIESMLLTVDPDNPRHVFGLGSDPILLMALIFSALVHDVGHTGVSNLQRAEDEEELVTKYNGDTSLHEHHSLNLAFDELAKDEYEELRSIMFLHDPNGNLPIESNHHFDAFKQMVWEAVLSTDIASPARAEAAKFKYFDAFPTAGLDEEGLGDDDMYGGGGAMGRRSSIASNISMPRVDRNQQQPTPKKESLNRRASGETVSSDVTMDSYSMMKTQNKVSRNTATAFSQRRASNGSGGSGTHNIQRRTISRRHSIETVSSQYSEFAADSIRMTKGVGDGAPAAAPGRRRASLSGGGPQRRLTATHSTDTGLAGMAYDRRASLGYGSIDSSGGGGVPHDRRGSGTHRRGSAGYGYGNHREGGRRRNQPSKANRTNSLDLVGAGVGGGSGEYDGDSSLSGSSGDEFDGVVVTGKPSDQDANAMLSQPISSKADREQRRHVQTRRMSNGVPVKFGSIPQGHKITEENPGDSEVSGHFEPDDDMLDRSSGAGALDDISDDLRRQVIMELCLRAADVAHWYQGWDTMIHFNRRIYLELCKASNSGRGFDPRPNWFDNQAKIMETYLLPLAEQIEYVGALRRGSGIDLVSSLESNNDLWLVRGFDVVEALKDEDE